tara:strand:+ start:402 stop:1016 length:615 start_codon:yes stop_codon:yes gene_type:complete
MELKNQSDLRNLYGDPHEIAVRKVLPKLDQHLRHFIELSPFLVLSTVRSNGYCDASPRGDAPGFVQILDESTLFLPDRPGNNRLDSMTNITSNPKIGILFMIPGLEETLRLNGKAEIISDVALLEKSIVKGKSPKTGLRIEVNECYIHCGKAIRRSKLWDAETHIKKGVYPSIGKIIADQGAAPGRSVKEIEKDEEEGYRNKLY